MIWMIKMYNTGVDMMNCITAFIPNGIYIERIKNELIDSRNIKSKIKRRII